MSVTSSSKEGDGRAWALRVSWSCCVAVEIRLESSRMRVVEVILWTEEGDKGDLGELKLWVCML